MFLSLIYFLMVSTVNVIFLYENVIFLYENIDNEYFVNTAI